ncbi:hypothetical protein ALC56_13401 [Trachymyrmex septentrionalis]|uniref:Uncharacterized protein n=1 Tax=Trachymyrmex septentrionalis TaxID=34720 RepID=A0A195EWD2_9HYME|nr:hypothetical protein ALC56_13401 [Trachymyrmex septentrionalis]
MKRVPHVVFLCTHPKGPKMSQLAIVKYMKKSKKNVDDLPERGSICKVDKQKGLDVSYETIRTYLKANNMNSTTLLLDLYCNYSSLRFHTLIKKIPSTLTIKFYILLSTKSQISEHLCHVEYSRMQVTCVTFTCDALRANFRHKHAGYPFRKKVPATRAFVAQ